jgi:hypothetical protein
MFGNSHLFFTQDSLVPRHTSRIQEHSSEMTDIEKSTIVNNGREWYLIVSTDQNTPDVVKPGTQKCLDTVYKLVLQLHRSQHFRADKRLTVAQNVIL